MRSQPQWRGNILLVSQILRKCNLHRPDNDIVSVQFPLYKHIFYGYFGNSCVTGEVCSGNIYLKIEFLMGQDM